MKSIFVVAILVCAAHLAFSQTTATTKLPVHNATVATHRPTAVHNVTATPHVTAHPTATHPTLPHTAPTHGPITHGTPAPTTKHVDHTATHPASTHPTTPPTTHPVTHPVTHTQAPTTKKPFVLDPKLVNLTRLVSNINMEVVQVDKAFELNAAMGNTFELTKLLDIIKQIKFQIESDMVEVRLEISSNTGLLQTYGRRLRLESLRLDLESYDRFLSAVGQTIMGSFGQLNKFPTYVTSENLGISLQLLRGKFTGMLADVQEVDNLISESQNKGVKIDQATKQKIDRDLEEIVRICTASKDEISKDFYKELERIRLEEKELNLLQKYEFEFLIDALHFTIDYTHHFEELFNRINN